MRYVTARERGRVGIGPGQVLTERDADLLARIEHSLPAGSIVWSHRSITFGPFCGVLAVDDLAIELLPKIWQAPGEASGVLVRMLGAVGDLQAVTAGQGPLGDQRLHLLDHFILDFCRRLRKSLEAGAIERYEQHEENLPALRGRLVIKDHLRLNAFNAARLYSRYDERTIDNAHNRALKAVLRKLFSRALGRSTKAAVLNLLHLFEAVSDEAVSPAAMRRLPFDRLTEHWRPVFDRGRRLLQGLFPDVRVGDLESECLLFNMERLFEAYVGLQVRRAWEPVRHLGYRVELQGPTRHLAFLKAQEAFQLRPDVVVVRGAEPMRILDTKWKELDLAASNLGLSPGDVQQLVTYASRYSCRELDLIFPASGQVGAGTLASYALQIPNKPTLQIHALDLLKLTTGSSVPDELGPDPASTFAAAA